MCLFLFGHRKDTFCPVGNDLIKLFQICGRGQGPRPFLDGHRAGYMLLWMLRLDLLGMLTALIMRRL